MKIKARPQKKVLSLVLCLAVMLSVMVVGAGAAFSDQDKIENTEAVDACSALNIINGYEDGAFHPERNIKRAEVTKMICVALNSGKDPNVSTNAVPTFTDVRGTIYEWAEGYIESCVAQGIVDGVGGTRFSPAGNVTAAQLAKMLLVGLGYNAKTENFTGNTWETNVNYRASQKGLYNGLEKLDTSAPVTRDQAAQMVWNALQAYEVEYKNGVVQDKVVADTDDKITLLRDRYNALISVGTLTGIYKENLVISMNDTDELASDRNNGKYVTEFSKLAKDYSNLMGQKVKVVYNRNHSDQVLGVFATGGNTIYNVNANETSKDDNKVRFGGKSYQIDGTALKTFIDGAPEAATDLNELDNNTLNPNAYTFVDSNSNGRLDTLVVKTYDVAQVSYVAADKIVANGMTYKYDDHNIVEGLKEGDWVVITDNLYKDNLDIAKAEMQTGTLNATRLDRDVTPYFDGADKLGAKDTYNEYQIGDTWFNGGEDLVQSKASENDLHVVRPGENVEYIAVNGIMFYVKKAASGDIGRVDDVAMIVAMDDGTVRDEVKIAFFDGTTKDVTVNSKSAVSFDKLTVGTVYEYDVAGGEYRFDDLQEGVKNEQYANYYGDLTYRGELTEDALSEKNFDGLVIDDNAQVLLFDGAKVKAISGKQFKAAKVVTKVDDKSAVYGFSGEMNRLDRIGALAVKVDTVNDVVTTWNHYGYIVTKPYKTGANTIEYTIWTKDGNITVREEKNSIADRAKGTVLGFDTLTELNKAPAGDKIEATHLISDVVALDTKSEITFTSIVDSNNSSVTFDAAPVYGGGAKELDVAGTVLFIDSDELDEMKIGQENGKIRDAHKDGDKYLANALVIGNNGDIELLIVDQGKYLENAVYKNDVQGGNTMYGDGSVSGEEPAEDEATVTVAKGDGFTVKGDGNFKVAEGTIVTLTPAKDYKITDVKVDNGLQAANKDGVWTVTVGKDAVKAGTTIKISVTVEKVDGSNPPVAGDFDPALEVTPGADGKPATATMNYYLDPAKGETLADKADWIKDQLNTSGKLTEKVDVVTVDTSASTAVARDADLNPICNVALTQVYQVSLNGAVQGYAANGRTVELTGYTVADGMVLIDGQKPTASDVTVTSNSSLDGSKKNTVTVSADNLDLWSAYALNLGSGPDVAVTAYQVKGGQKTTDGASAITSGHYAVPGTQIWVSVTGDAEGDLLNLSLNGATLTAEPLKAPADPYTVAYDKAITLNNVDSTTHKYELAAAKVCKLMMDGEYLNGYFSVTNSNEIVLPKSYAGKNGAQFVQIKSNAVSAAEGALVKIQINDENNVILKGVSGSDLIDGTIVLGTAVKATFAGATTDLDANAAVVAAWRVAKETFANGALNDTVYFAKGTVLNITSIVADAANVNDGDVILVQVGDADSTLADKNGAAADQTGSKAATAEYTISGTADLTFSVGVVPKP